MDKEYIIKLKLNDGNRNFGEILEQIENFLQLRDGIKESIIYKEIKE